MNAYTKYLINLSDKLINMCSNEELKILNPIINEIKKIENINFHNIIYQFNNVMSIIDETLTFQKEYKIYSIKQIKKNNFVKEETIDKNKKGNEDEFQNNIVFSEQNILSSVINAMDINSVSSVSSRIEGLTGLTGISNKRKNHSNENKSCNNIIIICFNLLVIILSIIALIYENNLNNELLNKISFYKVVHTFNMLILNTMFGYYSLLCYVKYDGEKCVHEMKYYLNDIEFPDIYIFNQYEHQLKINFLIDRYKTLRSKVANTKDKEIRNYLTTKKTEIHLIFEDNTLKNDKTSYETFDYLMGSFINKLMTTSNSDDFQTVNIFPLLVDDDFKPLKLFNIKNLNEFGSTQIYIYEIMISYLEYSNHFYSLQQTIEKKSNNQIKK